MRFGKKKDRIFLDFQTLLYFVSISKHIVISTQTIVFKGIQKCVQKCISEQATLSDFTVLTAKPALGREVTWTYSENNRNEKKRKVGKKGYRVLYCSSCSRQSLILLFLALWCSGIFFATIKGLVLIQKQWLRME